MKDYTLEYSAYYGYSANFSKPIRDRIYKILDSGNEAAKREWDNILVSLYGDEDIEEINPSSIQFAAWLGSEELIEAVEKRAEEIIKKFKAFADKYDPQPKKA